MKLTVVYDNEVKREGLWRGYGFSCFVEAENGPSILFDTGGDSATLLHNMEELNIDPKAIGIVVISHLHGDHTGGLPGILEINETTDLYLPGSFGRLRLGGRVITVKGAIQICENVFSTGELGGIEQSLALKTDEGIFVVTGCSHPGVPSILKAASEFGKPYGILGGFHGFREFKALESLSLIYPCHCTAYKREIRELYPDRAVECGAGLAVEL
jgi:7,8-dihydropterin-6-yl-methyl-4-(beta-D-ribofuranosyl)aminobenzene 5'-phosphate synthase